MSGILVHILRGYQLIVSPLLPPACRFTPTCSEYAVQALQQYGVFKGGWLAVCRIGRCHPWNPGGFDPVPALASSGAKNPEEPAGHSTTR